MKHYLLLLHGYTQNGKIIKKKITKLLSKTFLQDYIVISPDGPYIINSDNEKRGWWELKSPEIFTQEHEYNDYEKAIEAINTNILSMQSIDKLTIIAFSQGTVILEIMIANNLFKKKPNKIILLSPSGIMDKKLLKNDKITNIPSIVMFGEKEEVFNITPEHYQKYSSIKLDNYLVHIHKQGHVIPFKLNEKKIIKKFLSL